MMSVRLLLRSAAQMLPPIRRLLQDRDRLLNEIRKLAQERGEGPGSPFYNYASTFDALATIKRHAVTQLRPSRQHVTNYLGVKIDPRFFPGILDGRAGEVEPAPIPANWHADISEWAAALRAVELANTSFTVVELGCGWGCWMNITGVAARLRGLQPTLVGIEGDLGHIEFARQAARDNGFSDGQVHLHHGIAAATNGVALFPKQQTAGVSWGLEPVFGAGAEDVEKHASTHDALPMISLGSIAAKHSRIDLLHIDIQGGEAALIANCRDVLREHVAYVVVGTHSREIEGQIMASMLAEGWMLEIERPAIITIENGVPIVTVDGVQGWRNGRLFADEQVTR